MSYGLMSFQKVGANAGHRTRAVNFFHMLPKHHTMPPEFLESLFALHLVRLRFYAAVRDRLELPPLPGATLHGMLGPALAREACTCGAIAEAGQPGPLPPFGAHRYDCLFRQLYQPIVPPTLAQPLGFGKATATEAPAPHLIHPPLGRRVFVPGDRLGFEVVLIGRAGTGGAVRPGDTHAVAHWKRVVRAVKHGLGDTESQPAQGGLGRARIHCPLVEVCDGEGHPVWVRGYGFVEEPAVEIPARFPMPPPSGWVQVRLLTPAAVKDATSVVDPQGRSCTLSGPDPLGVLSRALVRRIQVLSALYCLGKGDPVVRSGTVKAQPTWMPDGLNGAQVTKPRSAREALEALQPVTFHRMGNHVIHAETGELHARNVPDDFVRLCLIAQTVGIGTNTTHGLGWFEVLA